MPATACEAIIPGLATDYVAYVNTTEYFAYIHLLFKKPPFWRPVRWIMHLLLPLHCRNEATEHMPGARPWLGLVLMRNVALRDHKAVGPALVLASSRFSAEGFDELNDVAEKMELLRYSSDRQAARAVESIYADEDYGRFRRRALPACVGAPEHIQLFDETMRGNDLLELPGVYKGIPHPFTVLFANTGNPAWSGVIPGTMLPPVVDALARDRFRAPPPLPKVD